MTNEELRKIDISNLRFYARMAREFKWGTDVLHFGVIVSTLEAIAERLGAAVSASPQPDRKILEAIAEDGLLVTWDKDFKFNFSQVVRLMAEFVIEHPWADAAQEQPVEKFTPPNYDAVALEGFAKLDELAGVGNDEPRPCQACGAEIGESEFSDALPLAKEKHLSTDRLNPNNLTISTKVFPLLHFEIIYTRGAHVDGMVRRTYHGLGETESQGLRKIRFTVDSDMQPCFTDGEHFLSPDKVAEELMEVVAGFFEKALKMPKYLA